MIKRVFGMAVLIVLSGCASAPYTYETVQGCGITQWNETWVQNDVASMSWTGGCSDGLASGRGSHVIKLKNGKEIRYVGDMYNGRIYGSGTYIDVYGWKSEGNFDDEKLTEGKLFNSKGEIVFDGKMANDIEYQGKTITYADARYGTGKVYAVDGSYYEGEFNGSIGKHVGGNALQASVYARNVRDGVVVGWFVAGKKYPNESAYQVAKSQYEDRRKREIAAHQAAQAAKQAAEQRAYEQEQARKSEQNARETREALGQLIGALGQYQQNSVDRKQAAAPLAARDTPVKKLEMVNEVDATQWQCNDKWKSLYRITITPTSLRIPRLTSSEQDTILEKQADGSFLHQDRPGSQAFKTIIRFQGAEKLNMAFTNLEGVINLTYDCTRMAPTGSAER